MGVSLLLPMTFLAIRWSNSLIKWTQVPSDFEQKISSLWCFWPEVEIGIDTLDSTVILLAER